jgi:hypothetical protein
MIFGSTVLEVAIGMIFVYLLLSLLASAINEYIEATLNYRGKNLRKGIELLLNDQEDKAANHEDLAAALYSHGLIRGLYRNLDRRKLPSYIPSRTFALALWHLIAKREDGTTDNVTQIKGAIEKLPNRELREALTILVGEAKGDFDQAIKNIGDWYEAGMDRASGWYKRRVQMFLLIIGFILASALNADTITIGKALFHDDALRNAIVDQAKNFGPLPTPVPQASAETDPAKIEAANKQRIADAEQQVRIIRAQLGATGLPLGWVETQVGPDGEITNPNELRRRPLLSERQRWSLKLMGLLITGFAISQGAPFWFDLLNKFMVIRSTVKPREKSREEGSKDATDDVSEQTDKNNDADTTPGKG